MILIGLHQVEPLKLGLLTSDLQITVLCNAQSTLQLAYKASTNLASYPASFTQFFNVARGKMGEPGKTYHVSDVSRVREFANELFMINKNQAYLGEDRSYEVETIKARTHRD